MMKPISLLRNNTRLAVRRRCYYKSTPEKPSYVEEKNKYVDTQQLFDELVHHPNKQVSINQKLLHDPSFRIPTELRDEFDHLMEAHGSTQDGKELSKYDAVEHTLAKLIFKNSLDEIEPVLPRVTRSILDDDFDPVVLPLEKVSQKLAGKSIKSNVLKMKRRDAFLIKSDLQRVLPSKYERQYSYDELDFEMVRGRYSGSLLPTGWIYLIFPDFLTAGCYYLETEYKQLNGQFLKCKFAEVSKEIQFIQPSSLSDLAVPSYLNIGSYEKPDISNLSKFVSQTLNNKLHEQEPELADKDQSLNQTMFGHTPLKDQDLSNPKTFQRSQACLFTNLPWHVQIPELEDFLWDYNLYGMDNSIRQVSENTWLVIFETQRDRDRCIRQFDHRHWYNNPRMPIVAVEAF